MELPIIYGSQTGNAAFLSELVRKSFLFGYNDFSVYNECSICSDKCVYTCEADRIDIKYLLKSKYIIFLTSTHGDGDEPFNSKNLWNFLRFKGLPANLLANLKFAVYGLGDSSYDKFNFYAKKLGNRLKALGAQEILARADGDVQDKEGYMTTFKPWLKLLHEYFADVEFKSAKHIPSCIIAQPTFRALVTDTKYVTPKDYKHAILRLELKIDDYKEFKPGDAIGIRPKNYNYKEFLTYNKDFLSSDDKTTEIEDQYVSWAKMEELLRSQYDFNFIPHQIIFLHLHNEISSNENLTNNVDISRVQMIQKLMEIYTIYDVYYDYIVKPKRTFFEVLQELRITITFSFIEKYIPKISPRYFSTAYVNDRYHVNVSLVNYKTKMSENRKGLCSEYLRLVEINTEMEVTIVKGNLDFSSENLLFICTGTGITLPFSAMQYHKDKNMLLFYGFRDSNLDQLYVDEMQAINDNKISIVTAPSRQGSRLYVQDVFKQYKDLDISKYKIIISGNTRLTKIFRALFRDLYPSKQVLFQSETW